MTKLVFPVDHFPNQAVSSPIIRPGLVDLLGIVQESLIRLYEQVVYTQPRICPGGDAQISFGFWYTNRSPNIGQTTKKKKKKKRKPAE